jgi:kynurenine formamidase
MRWKGVIPMARIRSYGFVATSALMAGILCGAIAMHAAQTETSIKGWKKGKGWGWIWGKGDEVGALNAMTDASRLSALQSVKQGKVYDLGVLYDRTSFKWPGHSPGEIIAFRTPEGVKRQMDLPNLVGADVNPRGTGWHSCALFINDNVATQIDGLGHVTEGPGCEHKLTDHWYNGFTEADWGGNWGPRKCDAAKIPPILARGVMIDVAALKKVDALPANYEITPKDLQSALAEQKTELRPGDVVMIRTGTLRYWGETGSDPEGKIKEHDSAGIGLDAAKWLIEQNGAMLIGSDTSGLEYVPTEADNAAFRKKYGTFIPVHNYLLDDQGVHIGELHNLEELSRDRVYEFCYVCMTNKIKGAAAGFTLRPVALK